MMNNKSAFYAALHEDFQTFVEWAFSILYPGEIYLPNWHVQALTHRLKQCFDGKVKDLIVTLPPRHLKSLCASMAFPAWVLGRTPEKQIICVSYGEDIAHQFAQATQTLVTHPDFEKAFPSMKLADNSTVDMIRTTVGGYRMATSMTGAATGFGCNYLIVDDATKASSSAHELSKAEMTFRQTLLTRHNSKAEGVTVLVGQRLHREDLLGRLLADTGWMHLNLPAIATYDAEIETSEAEIYFRKKGDILHTERESAETLAAIRKKIGDANFNAQYQQTPNAPEGAIFKEEWFETYVQERPLSQYDYRPIYIDTAMTAATTSNYTAAIIVGVHGEFSDLLHVWREHADFDRQVQMVQKLIEVFKCTHVVIENRANGSALFDILKKTYDVGLYGVNPVASKTDRAAETVSYFSEKRFRLPKKAEWLEALKQELFSFPSSAFDDQVDCIVYHAIAVMRGLGGFAPISRAAQGSSIVPLGLRRRRSKYGGLIRNGGYFTGGVRL